MAKTLLGYKDVMSLGINKVMAYRMIHMVQDSDEYKNSNVSKVICGAKQVPISMFTNGLSYFSMNDINIFMIYPSIKTMMIVTNQGKTWYINKLDNFNFEEAKSVMKDALEKYKDKDVAIEKFLKKGYSFGIERN